LIYINAIEEDWAKNSILSEEIAMTMKP
jgi:hypothetical protein